MYNVNHKRRCIIYVMNCSVLCTCSLITGQLHGDLMLPCILFFPLFLLVLLLHIRGAVCLISVVTLMNLSLSYPMKAKASIVSFDMITKSELISYTNYAG